MIAPTRRRDCSWGSSEPNRLKLPAVGRRRPSSIPHRRRLAGAVRAEQPVDVAPVHFHREVVHGDSLAEPLRQSVGLNDQVVHLRASFR